MEEDASADSEATAAGLSSGGGTRRLKDDIAGVDNYAAENGNTGVGKSPGFSPTLEHLECFRVRENCVVIIRC